MTRTARRIACLLAFLPLFGMAGCSDMTNPGGNVRVLLTASDQASLAPSLSGDGAETGSGMLERLQAANVTFSSLLARNLTGQLVDLGLDLPRTVDVVGLLRGEGATLPAGSLPPGDYDQLVVVMTELELTFINGGKIAVTPPGGGWTSIVRVAPFTVVEGQDLTIELNLRLGRAFREAGAGFGFFPEFESHHR